MAQSKRMKEFQAKQKALNILLEAQRQGDIEHSHLEADQALTDFLVALGHADVVAEWCAVKKWYA